MIDWSIIESYFKMLLKCSSVNLSVHYAHEVSPDLGSFTYSYNGLSHTDIDLVVRIPAIRFCYSPDSDILTRLQSADIAGIGGINLIHFGLTFEPNTADYVAKISYRVSDFDSFQNKLEGIIRNRFEEEFTQNLEQELTSI